MNVEIGTEAAQFPEKEYINNIFVAVYAPAEKADTVNSSYFYLPIFVLWCFEAGTTTEPQLGSLGKWITLHTVP